MLSRLQLAVVLENLRDRIAASVTHVQLHVVCLGCDGREGERESGRETEGESAREPV